MIAAPFEIASSRDKPRRSRRAGAFTLVELLVATTVTLLLVVVLVQVFNGASNSWRHSETQVDAYREARGALQLLARDLSATLQASYALPGGGADPTPAPGVPAGPALPTLVLEHYAKHESAGPTHDEGPINEEVYFLTNIHNGGVSSLCAVGYYCQWMPDNAQLPGGDQRPQAYALMRQSLDSNATFLRMKAASSSPHLGFLDLYRRDVTGSGAATSPPLAESTQVAAYIWDLRFRIDTDLNDSPTLQGAVPDGNKPAPGDHSTPQCLYTGDSGQPYPPRLPPYVEVRFKALSSLAGRRLEGTNTGVSPGTWKDTDDNFTAVGPYKQIIAPNYQQFILRVPLINATPLPN